jgi:ferredoxin
LDKNTREEPFEIDWNAHGQEPSPADDVEEPEPLLPVQPQPGDDAGSEDTLAELLDFHLYGRRGPRAVPSAEAGRAVPALLHPYHDLSVIRHDYPVCLIDSVETPVRPLRDVVDEVLARIVDAAEGEGERRRRHMFMLETEMRRICDAEGAGALSAVWDRAARDLLEGAASEEKREQLQQSFSAARDMLETDGELLPCVQDTPRRVFFATIAAAWRRKCAAWTDELETLYARANNILAADESHSADLHSPQHLRDATGGEDMDFDKMADLLQQSHVGEPLPEGRRNRIHRALDAISKMRPLFDGSVSLLDGGAKLPFDLQPVRNVCKAARDRHDERMRAMVEFFKAVRIAELEADNRYREKVHDRFFARFDATHLTDGERSFCPPVVLLLDGDFFESPDISGLFDLLGSGLPVLVFTELDDLAANGADTGSPEAVPGWPARLAAMLVALNDVHVSQTPASLPMTLCRVAASGFEYDGPAIASVYIGGGDTQPGLPRYLAAASALESRMFPAFVYDPERGLTQAERMSVGDNPHLESVWPCAEFAYADDQGAPQSTQLDFTAADFVFADIRFDAHFMRVDPSKWHKKMSPLHEYLSLEGPTADDRVPYITAVDEDGVVVRVAVTRHVVDMVRRVRAAWRATQESGGIHNSFAARLVAEESTRLEEQKKQEVEEIEAKYAANLERDLGDLTREIVQRIASQLLAEGTAVPTGAPMAAPQTAPAPVARAETAESQPEEATAAVEEEEDEDVIVTEDPYIDTPLCTSCNECTKINGQMFAYDENKQAYIADPDAGTFRELVLAAEKCPVHIIHPGKPRDSSEQGLDDLVKRAEPFN